MNDFGNPPQETVVDEIPRDECLALLATQSIGRLAVADHGYYPPHIVPVNFIVDDEGVVFRSNDGLKFKLSVLGEHSVSFEVDSVADDNRMAWSVVVQGRAELLGEDAVGTLLNGPWLRPLVPGERDRWVRIVPYAVTGRRIRQVVVAAARSGDGS